MSGGLPIFHLTANPFADHVLDPLARPEDADLFAPVDGFRALSEMGGFLAERAAGTGPSYVLVLGPDGSGRTSVANLVASTWKVASAGERRLLLPRADLGETRSARRVLAEWLACLRGEVRRAGLVLPPAVEAELRDRLAAGCDGVSYLADLRYLLADLDAATRQRGHFLVALFDDLDVVELAPALLTAFGETQALVVVVAGDYPSQLEPLLGEGGLAAFPPEQTRTLRLRHLGPEEVVELVRARWEHAVRNANADVLAPPLPFDHTALGPALAGGPGGPRTLRRILQILQQLLDLRQAQFGQARFGGGAPVSDEQLRFGGQELHELVRDLDGLGVPA